MLIIGVSIARRDDISFGNKETEKNWNGERVKELSTDYKMAEPEKYYRVFG
jgi:Mor family transcriptional regulator